MRLKRDDENSMGNLKIYGDMWLEFGFFRRDYKPGCHVLGEIQRKTNSHRLAAGLEPRPKKRFQALDLQPLQSVITGTRYKELNSQTWDAEKDDECHYYSNSYLTD